MFIRRIAYIKCLAWTLVFSTISLCCYQPRAQAMLVPSRAERTAQVDGRKADMQTVEKTLESKVLRDKLHGLGLSDQEIQSRLSRLSDQQVHQLASQIRAVHPAGDGVIVGILVIVVLVLLIIFLAKRI